MRGPDLDFLRYIERRRGAREAELREGAAYAFAGDRRVRRLLERVRPVTLALESTARLWEGAARAELLGTAVLATEQRFPRVLALARLAAERLHVAPREVHVSTHLRVLAHSFGLDDDPKILVHADLCDALSDAELLHVLGAELGHAQNGHVLLGTAQHFLVENAPSYARWIVRPAVLALAAYRRRAEITADRAGLLASRDLPASIRALTRIATAPVADGAPRFDSEGDAPDEREPERDGVVEDHSISRATATRIAALELFARSAYARGALGETGGDSLLEVDRRVSDLLRDKDPTPEHEKPPTTDPTDEKIK